MDISKLLHDLRNNIVYREDGIAMITRDAVSALADVIEQQEKTIIEKQKHLKNLQKVNEDLEKRIAIMSEGGWHFSGTPEIPEDEIYSYVLVWTGDKTVFPLVYHRRCVRGKDVFRYEWLNGDKYGAGKIKAWQYVPKPPKEGEQEAQQDYERNVEYAQYCERYEPTYNPEDGSM